MFRCILIASITLMIVGHGASQQFSRPIPAVDGEYYFPNEAPLREKESAKDKFRGMQADLKVLAREKFEAALVEFESRYREFLAGRGTLDFLIEVTERLRAAELAIADDNVQRLTAYERCWAILRYMEMVNQARYEAGRIPIQDMAQSKYARLDAEIQWAEERERQKKK